MQLFQANNSADKILKTLKQKKESFFIKRGEKAALSLFHSMSKRVPAYKEFLKINKINPSRIQTIEDFKLLPLTSKENYLLEYPIEKLCWDGEFSQKQWMISSTSGSTGEPFYFPRTLFQDKQFKVTAELCLLDFFDIRNKSTLFLDCFALGIWIGGMFMFQAVKYLVDQGSYKISIITPGADKVESIKAVKRLASHFDQIIIAGYGPLVKDLIDDGLSQGIDWHSYDVKYFFAAEGFTEGFRDYLIEKGGLKNLYSGAINHYGTADLGTMSHETPLSILIRQESIKDNEFYDNLFFNANKLPTLTQFFPELFYFEEVNGGLVCSSPSGLPLVRYNLKDRGGVLRFEQIKDLCSKYGIDIEEEIKKNNLNSKTWNIPFVYVGERADFTVSIYSVNIYPESIRKALEAKHLQNFVTTKFTMLVDFDEMQNQYLLINVELKDGVLENDSIKNQIKQSIIDSLNKENSEWRDFYVDAGIRDKVTPKIKLLKYNDPIYFRAGGKQKWVKR